ncbi:spore coat protein YutH [Clostridium sp. CAG:914]|nr:spore coat protein YutH [Clostridium sp. CAG:914]
MNNFIKFFYNMKVTNTNFINNYYEFNHNNNYYRLYILNEEYNIYNYNNIYTINKELINNTLMSEIILNKDKNIITTYHNINYILLKINCNINKNITLEEIDYLSKVKIVNNNKSNWGLLWSKKIDYLEELISENGKKYPQVVNSFNYFIGLSENAISYYNNIDIDNNMMYYISHKVLRPTDKVDSLYNPLNIIYDYRVRDVAEYIKNSFWTDNHNIYNELNNYLYKNNLSLNDVKLLISRVLFPSFYFDLYEDIFNYNKDEKILNNIISRIDEYEEYLNSIIIYFKRFYPIDEIEWLKKKIIN